MKLVKTLSCILILSLSFASYSEARGRSFGGGFRSQRMAPAPRAQRAPEPQAAPAAQSTQTRGMFGSFGRATPASPGTAPGNVQPSTMSRDLNTNAAQGNALKANDARTISGSTTPAAGATTAGATAGSGGNNSGWFRSGKPAAAAAPVQQQPYIVQQRGGGFLNNAMWFMLGSSLARNHQPSANQNMQNENHPGIVNAGDGNSVSGVDGQIADPLADMTPQVEEKESFFMSFLRLVLWAGIIFGVYKLVAHIMQVKKNGANKKPNYTFGN